MYFELANNAKNDIVMGWQFQERWHSLLHERFRRAFHQAVAHVSDRSEGYLLHSGNAVRM